ncbi:glycosyltransferase family 2 protein [uncultured Friedmanniella sp.]|uniref:glycosyltransferase family 2 protein n=1 Tax=uncultured Friedmanniella sp. TaxID=335381 RepID=UPI0035C9CD89
MTTTDSDHLCEGSTRQPFAAQDVMRSLSIVMPNYNYGHFIADAVQSALDIDWPDVEVIVVDDGSTDESLEVLAGFGDRITVISQANAGPRVACNRGFAASRGDVVIFLDSDDQVERSIAREVAAVWRPGISKVQVQMRRVDKRDVEVGGVFPTYPGTPSPEQIRIWMSKTSAYPTPPGSGNAYSRPFLERLFPLDGRCGDATDSACLAAAPYLGDVVTIVKPLVRYRIHENNRSKLNDPVRFTRQIERAYQRHRFALEVSGQPAAEPDVVRPLRRSRHLLQMRVSERRLNGGPPPVPHDSAARQLRDTLGSLTAPGPEPGMHRVAVAAWCLATLVAPQPLARRLIARRFG